MRIGFVGAGKVGFTLAKYFTEHNVCVSGFYSRSEESARLASDFTHSQYFGTLEELVGSSDALFLTVPDGSIERVWKAVSQYDLTGKCICHCSGAMSSAVFSEESRSETYGYSIHPLFAVSDKLHSYREISKAYFTIEGDEKYLAFWAGLFASFGNPVKVISAEDKTCYHAAAVFASNLVVGLFEESIRLLSECGFSRAEAADAIAPLFLNNAENLVKKGPADALTGPVERGDAGTVSHHLEVLGGETKEIYLRLSNVLMDVARMKNPGRDYTALTDLFERNGHYYEEHSSNI